MLSDLTTYYIANGSMCSDNYTYLQGSIILLFCFNLAFELL